MRREEKLLTVTINARLADEYRKAYRKAFVGDNTESQSLRKFIAGFVEDRLVEEIEFARAEAPRDRR